MLGLERRACPHPPRAGPAPEPVSQGHQEGLSFSPKLPGLISPHLLLQPAWRSTLPPHLTARGHPRLCPGWLLPLPSLQLFGPNLLLLGPSGFSTDTTSSRKPPLTALGARSTLPQLPWFYLMTASGCFVTGSACSVTCLPLEDANLPRPGIRPDPQLEILVELIKGEKKQQQLKCRRGK